MVKVRALFRHEDANVLARAAQAPRVFRRSGSPGNLGHAGEESCGRAVGGDLAIAGANQAELDGEKREPEVFRASHIA